jgi:hypothetical protein
MILKIDRTGATMHYLLLILSLVGFGLELTGFLLTVVIL